LKNAQKTYTAYIYSSQLNGYSPKEKAFPLNNCSNLHIGKIMSPHAMPLSSDLESDQFESEALSRPWNIESLSALARSLCGQTTKVFAMTGNITNNNKISCDTRN
jgi:hypothetical protein